MKNFFTIKIHFIFLIVTTIGFAQSNKIITSKEEAEKKGIYTKPSFEKEIMLNKPLSKKEKKALNEKEKSVKSILNTKNAKDIFIDKIETSYLTEQIVINLEDNLGVEYSYGGTTKNGFDCSGLLYSTFKKFAIDIPRSSHQIAEKGVTISPSKAEKGDFIFFATSGGNRITHVGMITEVNGDEILFVHASTSSGVVVSSLTESYYQNSFVQINRILEN